MMIGTLAILCSASLLWRPCLYTPRLASVLLAEVTTVRACVCTWHGDALSRPRECLRSSADSERELALTACILRNRCVCELRQFGVATGPVSRAHVFRVVVRVRCCCDENNKSQAIQKTDALLSARIWHTACVQGKSFSPLFLALRLLFLIR
jgi:hypothetical protein